MRKLFTFALNAAILSASSLVLRGMGVGFSVYLSNAMGAEGMGLYTLVMSVYRLSVTLASGGIALASTRLVAEELSHGRIKGAKRAVNICLLFSLMMGVASCGLLLIGAPFISGTLLRNPATLSSLYAMALSMPFISMAGALTGYFTGIQKVGGIAIAGIAEQIMRITFTVIFIGFALPYGLEYTCLALVAAGTLSEILSFLLIYTIYLFSAKKRKSRKNEQVAADIPLRMLGISVPVGLSSLIRSSLSTVEQLMVPRGLERSGTDTSTALAQYGIIRGMAMPIIMFPAAFITSFAGLLVPEITHSNELGQQSRIHRIVTLVLELTIIFSVGIAAVMIAFSRELSSMLYSEPTVYVYVGLLAPIVVVSYLDVIVDSILKGLGEQMQVVYYNIIDSVVGIFLLYFLLPRFGIAGYIVSILVTESLNTVLSLGRLTYIVRPSLSVVRDVFFPIALAALSCIAAKLLFSAVPLLAMIASALFYSLTTLPLTLPIAAGLGFKPYATMSHKKGFNKVYRRMRKR